MFFVKGIMENLFPEQWLDLFVGFLIFYMIFSFLGPPAWLIAYLLYLLE